MKKTIVLLAVVYSPYHRLRNQCPTKTEGGTGEGRMGDSTIAENKTERNKKVIMASMEAMMSKNIDEAFKDVAPDVVDYNDGSMPGDEKTKTAS